MARLNSGVRFHRELRMGRMLSSLTFVFALCCATTSFAADGKTAIATVREFYTRYLGYDYSKMPKASRPTIALSKAFLAEVEKTEAACKQYGEGPCGWGADGDEYLDTQEIEPGLSYSSSRMTIREISPNTVQVRLNVYPSVKDAGDYYQKTITYKMVRENGSFVVDDIAYTDGIATRKKLSEERKQVLAYPRIDAAGKRK
jgi:hypothetical protein